MSIEAMPLDPGAQPRPPKLKEYPKDWGNTAMEEMLNDILVKNFHGLKVIAAHSRYDDQRSHFDDILGTESGVMFAPDYTATSSPREMADKAREFVLHPLVKRRNDEGEVIDDTEFIKVIISIDDKVEWGRAYNAYLKEQDGTPTDYLSNIGKECTKIAERVVRQIDGLPEALRLLKKPEEYIAHVMERAKPVRDYFATELAYFKNKKSAPHH